VYGWNQQWAPPPAGVPPIQSPVSQPPLPPAIQVRAVHARCMGILTILGGGHSNCPTICFLYRGVSKNLKLCLNYPENYLKFDDPSFGPQK